MRSLRFRLLLAPPLAALVLVGCGSRGPSIPAIPSSARAIMRLLPQTGKAAVQTTRKKSGSRQKRLTQLSPMPWPKE